MTRILIVLAVVLASNVQAFDFGSVKMTTPPGATNIVYRGGGWVEFKYGSECFLMGRYGHVGYLSKVNCPKPQPQNKEGS